MANEVILLDTGVLIDHIRSTKKDATLFYRLNEHYLLAISSITGFELLIGKTDKNKKFTDAMLSNLPILDFDQTCMNQAVMVYQTLKKNSKLIQPLDIFIAATALANNLPVATLNTNHFSRIPGLTLV